MKQYTKKLLLALTIVSVTCSPARAAGLADTSEGNGSAGRTQSLSVYPYGYSLENPEKGRGLYPGVWEHSQSGWKWKDLWSGSYLSDEWMAIDGDGDSIAEYYCFDPDGFLYTDTVTPDGYTVDGNGAWTVGGTVQTKAAWIKPYTHGDGDPSNDVIFDGMYDMEDFEAFDDSGFIVFGDRESARNFLSEYLLQYSLYKMSAENMIYHYPANMEYYCLVKRYPDGSSRDAAKQAIAERFGSLEAETDEGKIDEVCRKLRTGLSYDPNMANFPVEEAVREGRGVCWHYSKIAAELLRDAGIPTDILFGEIYGENHAWLKCKLQDGTVIQVDPQKGILTEKDLTQYVETPFLGE